MKPLRPLADDEIADARAVLSGFTPDRPMIANRTLYNALCAEPALADMMDRVRVTSPLARSAA